MTTKTKTRPPVMDYETFRDNVSNFTFPEETDSYRDYIAAQRREHLLFEEAVRGGMRYVDLFRNYQQNWAKKKLDEQHQQLVKEAHESLQKAYKTGDKAFDIFTALCRKHDFWYAYSDDIIVYRNGNESYNQIQAMIEAQPSGRREIYAAYWNKIVLQHQPESKPSE